MSWFQVLLFVHVAMAVAWVGGAFMLLVLGFRYSQSEDRSRMASFGQDIEWVAKRVFTPASLIAFVTGVWLVVDSDFYGFGDDWIVMGLLLYATTFLAGLLFLGPESKRIGQLAEQGSPEAPPRILRLILLARLNVVLLFLIIYVMTVKPEFDSGRCSSGSWVRCSPAGSSGGAIGRRSRRCRPRSGRHRRLPRTRES